MAKYKSQGYTNVHFCSAVHRIAPHRLLCISNAHPRRGMVLERTKAAGGGQKPPLRPLATPPKPFRATTSAPMHPIGAAAGAPLAPHSKPRHSAGWADGPGHGAHAASAAARRSRCTRTLQLPRRPAKHDTLHGHEAGPCRVSARAWEHVSGPARCRMDLPTRLGCVGVVRARCGECTPGMPQLGHTPRR